MHLHQSIIAFLGRAAFEFSRMQPFIPTYLHLIASAILPIYVGSHASLSRPSSAARKVKAKKHDSHDIDDEDDEAEDGPRMEGLSATDAILFPFMAGATLTGLYFLIKWLQDPALLNKILNWYFAGFSVFSVSKMMTDGLDLVHSIAFPRVYIDQSTLYTVDGKSRITRPDSSSRSPRKSPLPFLFSRIPLPQRILDFLWFLQRVPNRRLQFKAFIRRVVEVDFRLGIHGFEGLAIGLTTVLWYNLVSKPWWLTNLMGFGFAYGTLQILSPTTFSIGSLVLGGLFFYDIYFVFYTPMMVTVAKSLDVPIKLLFPRPTGSGADPAIQALSMLGLGDVVLPGIMIGLALRFDLYMFYLRKQREAKPSGSTTTESDEIAGDDGASPPQSLAGVVKAPYVPVAGAWGDLLWTSLHSASVTTYVAPVAFPKPYFHASVVGYIAGMLVTLIAMQVSDHAQPALLYLVPSVLASLWGTAAAKGELGHMCSFSDAAEGHEEKQTQGDGGRRADTPTTEEENPAQETASSTTTPSKHGSKQDKGQDESTGESARQDRALVSFSIALPPRLVDAAAWSGDESESTSGRYGLRDKEARSGEPAGKRRRIA